MTVVGVCFDVIQVAAPAGNIMGGQGDSGGPMFGNVTGGVQARGSLLGADLESGVMTTSCGVTDPGGRCHLLLTLHQLCADQHDPEHVGVALEVG